MKEEIVIVPGSQNMPVVHQLLQVTPGVLCECYKKTSLLHTSYSTALLGYHCASTVYSPYRTKPACRWETFALPAALLHSTRIIFGQQLKQALHYTLHYALH